MGFIFENNVFCHKILYPLLNLRILNYTVLFVPLKHPTFPAEIPGKPRKVPEKPSHF